LAELGRAPCAPNGAQSAAAACASARTGTRSMAGSGTPATRHSAGGAARLLTTAM
jgi:hypothetical protein